jgi:hypothetical protein
MTDPTADPARLRRWASVFARHRARRSTFVYVGVRVLGAAAVAMAAEFGGARFDPLELTGMRAALLFILLHVAVSTVDDRRTGTLLLMGNLGVSRAELIALAVLPAVALETGLALLLAVTP